MDIKLINFDIKGDERGSLIALEENKNIPFDIKRVYYIFDTKTGVKRGFHAHNKLKQVLICVSGSCKITLDDGQDREEIFLSLPNVGLYISEKLWREMSDFSSDCVLMVIASEFYIEEDYIRNYQDFIRYIKNESNIG